MLRTARVLDEDLLNEAIRFFHILVVVSLADVTDVGQLLDAELLSAFAERLEGVLGLSRHDDVTDEAQKVALTGSVREILRDAKRLSSNLLQHPTDVFHDVSFAFGGALTYRTLKLLEHSLVLAHARDVARAEVAETLILRLRLMIDERAQERVVLHYRVVDLASDEVDTAFHCVALSFGGGAMVHKTRHERGRARSELAGNHAASYVKEGCAQRELLFNGLILERIQKGPLHLTPNLAIR